MRFQNKVVIVTGASAGIGAATALLFAKEGANVVIVGRNEIKLKEVEETAKKDGNKVFVVKADITKEDDAKRIINDTIDTYGKLDVLVNNAGIIKQGSILDGKLFDTFDEVMNTNLRAVVYLTTLAAPHLIKTKGNIINISSVLGKEILRMPFVLSYIASKAALDHFSRGAAFELGAHGVRVNVVSPGPVSTEIYTSNGMDVQIDAFAGSTLLNRISDPSEVAKLIAFLASDDAVGITGGDYLTDNGMCLK